MYGCADRSKVQELKGSLICLFLFFAIATGKAQDLTVNKDSIKGLSFSIKDFNRNIHASLKDSAVGWAYAIWKDDRPVSQNAGGFKIIPPDRKGGVGAPFTVDTRIHVASLSKTITAVAIAKLVEMKKLGWDSKVKDYLPSSWKLHPSFENMTVQDLLTMKSGLDGPLDALSSGYDSLRVILARGPNPAKVGKFNYQNTSYGLFRIVIAYATGYKEFSENNSSENASVAISNAYIKFVNEFIFQKAGIPYAECTESSAEPALRYPFPLNGQPGELTGATRFVEGGDLTAYAGGFGWYLSVADAGKLLNAVFYEKRILSAQTVKELTELGFPFVIRSMKYGNYFGTGGDWGHPIQPKGWAGIHAYFYCFPENVRIVVFVNSGEGSPTGKILRAYRGAFKSL